MQNPLDSGSIRALKRSHALHVPKRWLAPAGDDTEDAWVSVTSLRSDLDLEAFSELVADLAPSVGASNAAFLYYSTPLPGEKGYTQPKSMKLREDVDLEEVSRLWGMAEMGFDLTYLSMELRYEPWRASQQNEYEREARELKQIVARQKELLEVAPLGATEFEPEKVQIKFRWSVDAEWVDGLDLFNAWSVSRLVPIAQWVGVAGKRRGKKRREAPDRREDLMMQPVKVFSDVKPDEMEAALPTGRIQDAIRDNQEDSALYASVFAGRDSPEGEWSTKEMYVLARVATEIKDGRLSGGTISFHCDYALMQTVLTRINAACPRLKLDLAAVKFSRISGYFNLTRDGGPVTLDVQPLLMLIMVNPLLREYFYIEESSYVQTDKKRVSIHFRGAQLDTRGPQRDEEREESGRSALVASFLDAPNKMRIRVASARTMRSIEYFSQVIRRALPYVNQRAAAVYKLIGGILPKRKSPAKASEPSEVAVKRRNDELMAAAPDVFVKGYASKCQRYKPKIVDEDEAAEWRAKGHQVMVFPPPHAPVQPVNGPLLLVCDHETMPYPGTSPSNLSNADSFPQFPCCFKTDKMSPGIASHYNAYYSDTERVTRVQRAHVIRSNKPLAYARVGKISNEVAALLAGPVSYSRLGVETDPVNSLLHVACTALRVPEYRALKTRQARIDFAATLRKELFGRFNPLLLAQERVGLGPPTDDEPLASSLFYRLVEEGFGVNLFIVSGDAIETPRHRVMHVRPVRLERQSVLAVENDGSYELVIASNNEKPSNDPQAALLGPELTRRLFEAAALAHRVRTWSGPVELLPNVGSQIDLVSMLAPHKPVAQWVDAQGHARAVATEGGEVIEFWPAQPFDLPPLAIEDRAPPSWRDVIAAHGTPSSADFWTPPGNPTLLIGLWYSLGERLDQIYIAVDPEELRTVNNRVVAMLPIGAPGPVRSLQLVSDRAGHFRTAKRAVALVSQWVAWAWKVAGRGMTPAQFVSMHSAVVKPEDEEESGYYTPPARRTFPEGMTDLRQMHVYFPTLFDARGWIRVPSVVFRNRLAASITRILNNHPESVGSLRGVFSEADDFEAQPRARVFMSPNTFDIWHAAQRRRINTVEIEKLGDRAAGDDLPAFSSAPSAALIGGSTVPIPVIAGTGELAGRAMLIQNVLGGEFRRALSAAMSWRRFGKNTGFRSAPVEASADELPATTIYGLTPAGLATIESFPDAHGDSLPMLRLTIAGRTWYAAILLL